MSNQYIFILVILIILVVVSCASYYDNKQIDGFDSNLLQNENNSGLYNYFYMRVMNPYSLPMLKFFTNDTQKPLEPNQNF